MEPCIAIVGIGGGAFGKFLALGNLNFSQKSFFGITVAVSADVSMLLNSDERSCYRLWISVLKRKTRV